MIRMQIQLTDEQARRVRRLAARKGISNAAVVRLALDDFLAEGPGPDENILRQKARSRIGAFPGGPSDVSDRHDEYFAGDVN